MKGIVITTENTIKIQDFERPLWKTVGEVVGGYIEKVNPRGLDDPFCMIVNEEGLLKGLPLNLVGSHLYQTYIHGAPIVGNIVIMKLGITPEGPDIIGLDEQDIQKLYPQFVKSFNLTEI